MAAAAQNRDKTTGKAEYKKKYNPVHCRTRKTRKQHSRKPCIQELLNYVQHKPRASTSCVTRPIHAFISSPLKKLRSTACWLQFFDRKSNARGNQCVPRNNIKVPQKRWSHLQLLADLKTDAAKHAQHECAPRNRQKNAGNLSC